MPRPRAMAAFASAPGEGRVCHFIIVATRLISSMPRGLLRLRKRNSIGSMPAAAASSSVKLSTAKQLAGLPGERNSAGNVQQLRRSLGVPAMFIRARPLHADGAPDRPRQDRRVGGGVLMAVHAIAPGAFEVDQAHLVLGQPKEAGEGGTIVMRALGCGPHRGLVGTHVGDGAGRTE